MGFLSIAWCLRLTFVLQSKRRLTCQLRNTRLHRPPRSTKISPINWKFLLPSRGRLVGSSVLGTTQCSSRIISHKYPTLLGNPSILCRTKFLHKKFFWSWTYVLYFISWLYHISIEKKPNSLNEKNANRHDLLNQMPTFCCLYDFEYFHTEIVTYLYICNTVYYTYDYIAISWP